MVRSGGVTRLGQHLGQHTRDGWFRGMGVVELLQQLDAVRLDAWLGGGQLAVLAHGGLELDASPVTLAGLVQAADLVEDGKISSKQLKGLFDICFEKSEDFGPVYEREKPQQITDSSALEAMIDEVIAANPAQVAQYKAGKKTVAGFFVGQVMRASKGQANPALLNELVTKKLDA